MAKNEKKSSGELDAQQAKEAKKKLKEAEKAGAGAKKDKAEKTDKKKSVKFRRFWKDFRGELKKIVWPDFKTVVKNTGIVLLTTVIIGVPVWILDYALSEGVLGLKKLAQGAKTEAVVPAPDYDFDLEDYLAQMEQETAAQTQPAGDATQPAAEPAGEPGTAPAATEEPVIDEEPVTAVEE